MILALCLYHCMYVTNIFILSYHLSHHCADDVQLQSFHLKKQTRQSCEEIWTWVEPFQSVYTDTGIETQLNSPVLLWFQTCSARLLTPRIPFSSVIRCLRYSEVYGESYQFQWSAAQHQIDWSPGSHWVLLYWHKRGKIIRLYCFLQHMIP